MADQNQPTPRILRRPEVVARTGLSYSTIVRRMAEGTFPAAFKLGTTNAVGWKEESINRWISEQAQSREASPDLSASLEALAAEAAKHSPDLMVQLDGMEQPMRLADAMAAIRAEVAREMEHAHLIQVAAQCQAGSKE